MTEKGKGGFSAKFFLCAALVLCLVSMIGASLIQTQNHKIRIKQMTWETPAGHQISADLWIPQNATAQSPAPAVITIEGWYNNKEMQDLYTLELARRGYVVLTMVLTSVGIPAEGLALILGIDRPLDMLRTAVNVTGDATVAVIVDRK